MGPHIGEGPPDRTCAQATRPTAPDELEPLRVWERRGARWHVEELEDVVLHNGPAIGRRAGQGRATAAAAHRMVRVLLLSAARERCAARCASRSR